MKRTSLFLATLVISIAAAAGCASHRGTAARVIPAGPLYTGAPAGVIPGAAGGAAVQVATKGDHIQVPAETLLTFQLDNPIRLRGYHR